MKKSLGRSKSRLDFFKKIIFFSRSYIYIFQKFQSTEVYAYNEKSPSPPAPGH